SNYWRVAGLTRPAPFSPAGRVARGVAVQLRVARLVERASDDLSRERSGELAVFEEHGAVDDHAIDADSVPLDLDPACRQIGDRLARFRRNRVGVEDRDVGRLARGDEAAVVQVVHQRGLAGQPGDRFLSRRDRLRADPMTQQVRAVLGPVGGVRPRPAVAGADHRIARAEDLLLRLRVGIAVDGDEAGLQVLVEREVEEGVHYALILHPADLGDALAL